MKSTALLLIVLSGLTIASAEPLGEYQHGTVVRMRMGDCTLNHRGFANAFGPPQGGTNEGACPEYVLVTDKVVFVIVGRSSNQLVPLRKSSISVFRKKNWPCASMTLATSPSSPSRK